MKSSFVVATLFTVTASAASVGAFSTNPYLGSETLFDVTNQAIQNAGLGNATWDALFNPIGDYAAGGSSAGEIAMVQAKQQTAPMSRMLSGRSAAGSSVAKGACAATSLTQASGIVIGLDVASLFMASAVGCNGPDDAGPCTPIAAGLVPNWRDVLALLYGGLDRSTGIVDCASAKRAALVGNFKNLFQGPCTDDARLCHAWRRDDFSGTSDVFSSLLGLQNRAIDANGNVQRAFLTSGSAVNGFGTTPFCNALNWDPIQVASGTCAEGGGLYVGPGGIFAADAMHKIPPAGAYGSVASGQPFVFSTSWQDNDPIRNTCLGTAQKNRPAQDICNTDGKTGIVLSIAAFDFIPSQSVNPDTDLPTPAYTNGIECTSGTVTGAAPRTFACAPRGTLRFSNCPDNSPLQGGSQCAVPVGPSPRGNTTSSCLTTKGEGPCALYGGECRFYNTQAYNGSSNDAAGAVGYVQYVIPQSNGTTISLDFGGAFARIHERETEAPGLHPCTLGDVSDQIGCLVQAEPCSIGFGTRSGATWESRDPSATTTGSTTPIRVGGVQPGAVCTPSLAGTSASYPLWRKLYMNSITGFSSATSGELALAQSESSAAFIDPILSQYDFFPLPFSPNGSSSAGPNPFCEDFNQTSICGVSGNTNACNANVAPIPSDPSTAPASATRSTVCGNGIVEAFEDCDPAPPASSPSCDNTCRFSN